MSEFVEKSSRAGAKILGLINKGVIAEDFDAEAWNAQIAELVVKYRNAEKFQYKVKNAIDNMSKRYK